jgi:hypothetical protein
MRAGQGQHAAELAAAMQRARIASTTSGTPEKEKEKEKKHGAPSKLSGSQVLGNLTTK